MIVRYDSNVIVRCDSKSFEKIFNGLYSGNDCKICQEVLYSNVIVQEHVHLIVMMVLNTTCQDALIARRERVILPSGPVLASAAGATDGSIFFGAMSPIRAFVCSSNSLWKKVVTRPSAVFLYPLNLLASPTYLLSSSTTVDVSGAEETGLTVEELLAVLTGVTPPLDEDVALVEENSAGALRSLSN